MPVTDPSSPSRVPAPDSKEGFSAPLTLEGWYVLHDMFAIDWPRWNAAPASERAAIMTEAGAALGRQARPSAGHSACYSLLTQKGDLAFMHYREDLQALRAAELELRRTRLYAFLQPTYAYLSVIELGTFDLKPRAERALAKRGVSPESPGYTEVLTREMTETARARLFPDIPSGTYCCFYPMSKRRGEHVNWYSLSEAERGRYMRGHGRIGSKYAGKVVQVISGSVGFDDWEWGVTLFADDPLLFKKLIYEMRFDPASSLFAMFGPFYVGIRLAPGDLATVLDAATAAGNGLT